MFRWNPLDHADDYRQAAKDRRERGGSAVQIFKTVAALPLAPLAEREQFSAATLIGWRSDRDDAIEAYRRSVWPERFEGFDL